tara:strand:- start:19152 stop:19343 length:192 start_codon:yes stop_codon:yes gene_type:complete
MDDWWVEGGKAEMPAWHLVLLWGDVNAMGGGSKMRRKLLDGDDVETGVGGACFSNFGGLALNQ